MNSTSLKQAFPIAGIFACRMLGLFLLIPVFTLYADKLTGARPALIGIALGAYGFSQGVLQIPFGILSDKYGRKPLIITGLILLAVGSLIGAYSHSIYGVIIARVLQGTGAIGSVLIALLSDVIPVEKRTPAMAIIGGTIGFSFNIALLCGPPIAHQFGLPGIFITTFGLALLGLLLLTRIEVPPVTPETSKPKFRDVLSSPMLARLNLAIFCQHAIFTATFFVMPFYLKDAISHQKILVAWHFYLPILLCAFVVAIPLLMLFEKRHKTRFFYLTSIIMIGLSQGLIHQSEAGAKWALFCGLMFLYFVAFNALEALLPSLVSKKAPAKQKGAAMGIYSSSQFLGIFVGGSMAGLIAEHYGLSSIFMANTLLTLIWFGVSASSSD